MAQKDYPQILKVLVGSHAHGLATAESDYDYRAVFVQPTEEILGLGHKAQNNQWLEGDIDNTSYEVGHFLFLASKSNPTILEVFHAPRKGTVIDSMDLWDWGNSLVYLFPKVSLLTDVPSTSHCALWLAASQHSSSAQRVLGPSGYQLLVYEVGLMSASLSLGPFTAAHVSRSISASDLEPMRGMSAVRRSMNDFAFWYISASPCFQSLGAASQRNSTISARSWMAFIWYMAKSMASSSASSAVLRPSHGPSGLP